MPCTSHRNASLLLSWLCCFSAICQSGTIHSFEWCPSLALGSKCEVIPECMVTFEHAEYTLVLKAVVILNVCLCAYACYVICNSVWTFNLYFRYLKLLLELCINYSAFRASFLCSNNGCYQTSWSRKPKNTFLFCSALFPGGATWSVYFRKYLQILTEKQKQIKEKNVW